MWLLVLKQQEWHVLLPRLKWDGHQHGDMTYAHFNQELFLPNTGTRLFFVCGNITFHIFFMKPVWDDFRRGNKKIFLMTSWAVFCGNKSSRTVFNEQLGQLPAFFLPTKPDIFNETWARWLPSQRPGSLSRQSIEGHLIISIYWQN